MAALALHADTTSHKWVCFRFLLLNLLAKGTLALCLYDLRRIFQFDMTKKWIQVSPEEASQHSLYGVKGWLLMMALGMLGGLIQGASEVRLLLQSTGLTLGEVWANTSPAVTHMKVVLGLSAAMTLATYWMMFTKQRFFRVATTSLYLASFPLAVLSGVMNPFDGVVGVILPAFVPWAVAAAVWGSYLHLSQRVRVTYEHKVLAKHEEEPQPDFAEDFEQPRSEETPLAVATAAAISPSPMQSTPAPGPLPPPPEIEAPQVPVHAQPAYALDTIPEDLWAQALKELESDDRRPGLWAQCYAQTAGEDKKAKALYLEKRAAQLQSERLAKTETLRRERAAKQAAAEERLAQLSEEERAYALLPKGLCPSCALVMPLDSPSCPRCKAIFGADSAWSLKPQPGAGI